MKLEIALLAGHESKAFLVELAKLIDRMEKAAGLKTLPSMPEPEFVPAIIEDAPEISDVEDDDFAAPAKKRAAKAKAPKSTSFDDDDSFDIADEVPQVAAKARATKVPAVTADDVNDACKAKCVALGGGAKAREQVKAILIKRFGTSGSISELKPEQYKSVVDAMRA